MTIKLHDYDLDAARIRFTPRIQRERGLAYDARGAIDDLTTRSLRSLRHVEPYTGLRSLLGALVRALERLPVELGGTVAAVEGGYAALPSNLSRDLPLVHALMVLRGHPNHTGFDRVRLHRTEQVESYPAVDIAPNLEEMYSADPLRWDQQVFERIVLDGAKHYCGDVEIEPEWDPDQVFPGSQVGEYMWALAEAFRLEAFGALAPGFTRTDALVGEWWLLQPVSPRLQLHVLAERFGLYFFGILPPSHLDHEGRVVMACFPTTDTSDQGRIELIEDSKWIAGFKKVMWKPGEAPLTDPRFDLPYLQEIPEEGSYGPYRHSSELPPWP